MPDRSHGPLRRFVRAAAVVVGWPLMLGAGVSLLAIADGGERSVPVVLAAALGGFVPIALAAASVVFLVAGHRRSGLLALALLATVVIWLHPQPRGGASPSGGVGLTVITANLLFGQADAGAFVADLRTRHPDILVLNELTPGAVGRLRAAGIGEVLPYDHVAAADGPRGTAIWSRTPLTATRRVPGLVFEALEARTVVAGRNLTLVGVHPTPPFEATWASDIDALRDYLASRLAAGESIVLAGDFNASQYNGPFERLLDAGFDDAAARRSWSFQVRTWPANKRIPQLLRIDHVLVRRGAGVEEVASLPIAGSDHAGVVARVVVP